MARATKKAADGAVVVPERVGASPVPAATFATTRGSQMSRMRFCTTWRPFGYGRNGSSSFDYVGFDLDEELALAPAINHFGGVKPERPVRGGMAGLGPGEHLSGRERLAVDQFLVKEPLEPLPGGLGRDPIARGVDLADD